MDTGIISKENCTSVRYIVLPKLIRKPTPDYWVKTSPTTNGLVYLSGFIADCTAAIEHINIKR